MVKIKELARIFGWTDAYVRYLNREIRSAGHNLIGTHDGMILSDSMEDRFYQVKKMLKQASDMEQTAALMLKGEHTELSEDAQKLFDYYNANHKQSLREIEIPEMKKFDFIEVRDGKIV